MEENNKCNNFDVCDTLLPDLWNEYKGKWLCTNCDMMFGTWGGKNVGKGTLIFVDDIECPICLENKKCVSQPRCDHFVCIDCFKRCYYGDEDKENEPLFPYPDIEDEYFDDPNIFFNKLDNYKYKEAIEEYEFLYNIWFDKKDEKYEKEEYLRRCPLCKI